LKTVLLGVGDALKQLIGLSPIYVKAAADPGEVGILTASGAEGGLYSIVANAAFVLLLYMKAH
jgi:hypothetical protein